MSLTIPFRVFGSYHYHKINDDLIDPCENCPVFNDNNKIDIKVSQSYQMFNYCRSESCIRNNGDYYEHMLLLPVGITSNSKIDKLVYNININSITSSIKEWKSMLSICPNCYKFYYVPNIKTHMEDIIYKTSHHLTDISFNHDDTITLHKYTEKSLFTDMFINDIIDKSKKTIKEFIDCEIPTHVYLMFNYYMQLFSQLSSMYYQTYKANLKQFQFSIGLIWLTKIFYISECIHVPPTTEEEYKELFDYTIRKYIKNVILEFDDVIIKYDLTNIQDININNIVDNSIDITVTLK
jgi:hypothetical protein